MPNITVKTTVRRSGGDSMKRLAESITAESPMVAMNLARFIANEARKNAPVLTGFLRNSITAEKVAPGHWVVKVGAGYAGYVNYGTSRQRAQPFFTQAVEAGRRQLPDEFKKVLR